MNNKDTKIAVLIVAGGSGERLGGEIPKQYRTIGGKTVFNYTVEKFLNFVPEENVQCVIGSDHQYFYDQSGLADILSRPPVTGGQTRQESVFAGLKSLSDLNPDIVLIHDAARPCVKEEDVNKIIHNVVHNKRSATLVTKVHDTIIQGQKTLPRDDLLLIQTPQVFPFQLILDAHHQAVHNRFIGTDDASIAVHAGHDVDYVEGSRENIKITQIEDLWMAEKLLLPKTYTKTGLGFDVHAFKTEGSDTMRLCGIDIPFSKALDGHSDADIGLHVITDAILGALAEHDIGYHFPSSDKTIENIDSHIFVQKALELLAKHNGRIVHLDITFMCEKPNIGKYRDQMREHLSDFLNIPLSRLSIKGTTTQKLGFLGREEAVACQCLATIEVPA